MRKVIYQDDKAFLVRKHHKGILSFIFSNAGLITLSLALEALFLWEAYKNLLDYVPQIFSVYFALLILTSLHILQSDRPSDSKLCWCIVAMIMPIIGSCLYFYVNSNLLNRRFKSLVKERIQDSKDKIVPNPNDLKMFKNDSEVVRLHNYLSSKGLTGFYTCSDTQYFPNGESQLESMLEKLKEAKDFIFIEYFIIEEGEMWGKILKILLEKVKHGVDVKIIYDGTCDFKKLPRNYAKYLNELGMQTVKFSTVYPFISMSYNFRDHRKIMIIDGKYAYVGGTNLADEYINQRNLYGHWKDTCLLIQGEAVKSYTLMFLQMFSYYNRAIDYCYLYTSKNFDECYKGVVIPYCDGPYDQTQIIKTIYMDIINNARDYVYIMTPYLITDDTLETCIRQASLKGVDVRIILPGVADKKLINYLAKERYQRLMDSGVKVYEYDYGFVHGKMIVSDGIRASIGSANLDYRSLYHNFESGTYLYNTETVLEIEQDFITTFGYCHKMLKEEVEIKHSLIKRIVLAIMKFFEPLL